MHAYLLNTVGLSIIVFLLSACGGDGFNQGINNKVADTQEAVSIVLAMNQPMQRTPQGFYSFNQDTVEHDYFHVRTDHINPSSLIRSDLSTDDPQQALVWAQQTVINKHPNATFYSSNETPWFYENTWSLTDSELIKPRLLSARVFKGVAIDRSVYDANQPTELLAVMSHLPLTAANARFISEYLWTYSGSNNVGHVILSSRSTATITGIRHTLREAVFNPVGSAAECVAVQIWNVYYDIDSISGGVTLTRSIQREFHAKENSLGQYTLCQNMAIHAFTTEQGNPARYY